MLVTSGHFCFSGKLRANLCIVNFQQRAINTGSLTRDSRQHDADHGTVRLPCGSDCLCIISSVGSLGAIALSCLFLFDRGHRRALCTARINSEGIRGVIEAVKQAPRIRRLSVAGCQLGLEGGRVMFSALGEGREVFRLEDLDLSFNSIGAGVGEILEQALRLNQTLTRLNLRYVVDGVDMIPYRY